MGCLISVKIGECQKFSYLPNILLYSDYKVMEIRKIITLFSREIQVSNLWNTMIKSLKWEWRKLKQYTRYDWYMRVNICEWKCIHQWFVHRLVASAFLWLDISNWREQCALHKNDIRNDNRVENIYIGTYKDNAIDRANRWRGNSPKWSKNTGSVLKEEQVVNIKHLLKEWNMLQRQIWNLYWVSKNAIQSISSWKTWKHIII
jgi:hypothetical protein